MGQSLKKLAPGLLSNSSYFKARALNFEVVDELLGELSILSKETGAKERSDENKEREIGHIIEGSYEKYFGEEAINKLSREVTASDSYFTRAVCEIVEQINTSLNSTQLRLPKVEKLKEIYITILDFLKTLSLVQNYQSLLNHEQERLTEPNHSLDKGQQLEKEEFQKILHEIIIHSGFTGFGSKDTILFIFGIPLITYFIKQRVAPKSIPNEVFIPGVTSASVYLLAKLNKT